MRDATTDGPDGPDAPAGAATTGERMASRGDRLVRLVMLVQGVVLTLVGGVGLVWSALAGNEGRDVLVFRVNVPHGLVLLVFGVLCLVFAGTRSILRWLALAQFVGFTALFVYARASSADLPQDTVFNLNDPDHVLHLVLAVVGLALAMGSFAVVPRPGRDRAAGPVRGEPSDRGRGAPTAHG
ncbi:MAG TPA: DUF4383 domain-containing protein [Pseudonocardiaceae bacterium]